MGGAEAAQGLRLGVAFDTFDDDLEVEVGAQGDSNVLAGYS